MKHSGMPAALNNVIEMQGFDATIPASRDVYAVLNWNVGARRRTYKSHLIFDGDQCGLGEVLSEFDGSTVCIGRGSVCVGVDELVSLTFARRFDTGGRPTGQFLQKSRQSVSLERYLHRPQGLFGPFSVRQQLYAADLIDVPIVTIYGFRARWAIGDTLIEERCFLLQAESPDDAVALLREHLAEMYPQLDIRQVSVEMDNSRLETVVSHFSLFSSSRVSELDEDAFIDCFRLGSVIEP